MDVSPEQIPTLVGREVYSNNGVFVGEVEDVRIDLRERQAVTALAVHQLNHELFEGRIEAGKGALIPYRWVRAVGDVILINDVIERLKDPEEERGSISA